jgi:hypothetical protein
LFIFLFFVSAASKEKKGVIFILYMFLVIPVTY